MTAYEERVEREDRLKPYKVGAYVTDNPHYERLWVMGMPTKYIGGTSLVAQDRK